MWRSKPGPEIDPAASAAKKMSPQGVRDLPKRHTGMSMDLRRVQLSGSAAERGSQEMSRTQSMEVAERPSFGFGTLGHRPNANTVPPGKTPDWEGWLAKESKMMLMSKWQKRYFVLFGKHLLYWVEEADFRNGMPFKGNVNLEGCSLVENAAKGQQKQCFGIHHPQRRDYLLAAGSPELLAKWVNKIEGVLGPYLLGENVSMADFDILSVVGKGAAGTVYQVRKRDDSEVYAMKVILKASIKDRMRSSMNKGGHGSSLTPAEQQSVEAAMQKHWMVQSVKMERKILEAVNHPFIVRLFYAFQTTDKLCFVLDFVNGGELYTHIAREKKFTEDRARFYAGEIILALEYLHEIGIIYRDLKPENILLDSEGHVKLTDFGQSRGDMSPPSGGRDETVSRRSFSLVGSPYYMAPEIFLKEGHGVEADWWSLGILIYEMLVGLPPFYNENTSLAYRMLLQEEIEYPSHVSVEARKLCKSLLHVNHQSRFGAVDPPGIWNTGGGAVARVRAKWNFAWLMPIDWGRLLAKQIKPPFRPRVSNSMDLGNISSQFTSERVRGLDTDSATPGSHSSQEDPFLSLFQDFSFSSDMASPALGFQQWQPGNGKDRSMDGLSVLMEAENEDRSVHGNTHERMQ